MYVHALNFARRWRKIVCSRDAQCDSKGPGKLGYIVADTLLPTQMFPRLPACATFVADTTSVSGTQTMFLIFFRNILCPQQMFPSLRSPRNIMGNNMSSCTRALRNDTSYFISKLVRALWLVNLAGGTPARTAKNLQFLLLPNFLWSK